MQTGQNTHGVKKVAKIFMSIRRLHSTEIFNIYLLIKVTKYIIKENARNVPCVKIRLNFKNRVKPKNLNITIKVI